MRILRRSVADERRTPGHLLGLLVEGIRVKEKPILFSGPMIKALLEGRKTQTRRVIKDSATEQAFAYKAVLGACPYGNPKDRLIIKETHYLYGKWDFAQRPSVPTRRSGMK